MDISIPGLADLNHSMTEVQYWFTVAAYVFMGVGIILVGCLIYKVLSCGACIVRCLLCPCRSRKRKEERDNLLRYDSINYARNA